MGARATLVRLRLLAVDDPNLPPGQSRTADATVPARPPGSGRDCPPPAVATATGGAPLTAQRLRLRADLAYALAAVDGRRRVADEDLAAADRLALRLLDRWSGVPTPSRHGSQ